MYPAATNTTLAVCHIPIKSRSDRIIYTNAVFSILATFALFVRLLVCAKDRINVDDAFAVAAWVFSLVPSWGMFTTGLLGNGTDTWAVPADNIYTILKVCVLIVVD